MSAAAETTEKPGTTGKNPPPSKLAHIYCRCSRGEPVRTAFCGHVGGSNAAEPYRRSEVTPDLCNVCVYMEEHTNCRECGK